jgi:hypothetical protein
MLDTEREDTPNIMWEISKGEPVVIAFTGMADRLHEMSFEWVNSTRQKSCSKIYCKDPDRLWFHTWTLEDLEAKLRDLLSEMNPSRVTCIGASAGGYAAIYFGHVLEADRVHAFGPQTYISKGMIHYENKTIMMYEMGLPCHNLKDILLQDNGKTGYKIHTGSEEQDLLHASNLEGSPGVEVVRYSCDTHACASQLLKSQGILHKIIMS